MDRVALTEKLRRLREQRYPEIADFRKASKIAYTQVQEIEGGAYPRLDTLDRWLTACGTTPAKFFAELEGGAAAKSEREKVIERFSVLASTDVDVASALTEFAERVLRKTRSANKPR